MKNNQLQYLLDNHFQSLKNENIKFVLNKQKDSFAYKEGFRLIGYTISFSKKDYKQMTTDQIRGVLSHELSHILHEINQGSITTYFNNILYMLSAKFKTKEERIVDKLVIDRGCGRYLLELIKYNDKHYDKYTESDGLTKKEVKKILKSKINKQNTI